MKLNLSQIVCQPHKTENSYFGIIHNLLKLRQIKYIFLGRHEPSSDGVGGG